MDKNWKGEKKEYCYNAFSKNCMKAKKVAATLAACGLVAAMALGGTLAYLTDNESHTNSIRVSGDVKVDLVEENWPQEDENNDGVPDEAEKMVPNQEVSKDPKVINTGKNDAFAFIRLTVPVKDVTKISDDGALMTREDDDSEGLPVYHEPQDIFYFKQAADAINSHVNNFGAGWLRLKDEEFNVEKVANADGSFNKTAKQGYSDAQTIGQAVYVFGYNTKLAGAADGAEEGGSTSTLFDKVQIKNIIENELASDQIQNIKVEAFAIQADNVIGADGKVIELSGAAADAATDSAKLKEIYDIFVNQNGDTESDGSFKWNTYQDDQHGQTEKEADTNNQRDLANSTDRLETTYKIAIDKSILTPGETASITPTVTQRKAGATGSNIPTYSVLPADGSVVTVAADGTVTAVSIGDATIVAELDGVKTSVHVSVQKDKRPVTGNEPDNDADPRPVGTTTP